MRTHRLDRDYGTDESGVAYVDCLMNWVQGMLDDESVFPSKIGTLLLIPVTVLRLIKEGHRRIIPQELPIDGQIYRPTIVQGVCSPLQPSFCATVCSEY